MNFLEKQRAPKWNPSPVGNGWFLLSKQTEDAHLFANAAWKIDTERVQPLQNEKPRTTVRRRNITTMEREFQRQAFDDACDLLLPRMLYIQDVSHLRCNNVQLFDGKRFTQSLTPQTRADGSLIPPPTEGWSYVILNPITTQQRV